MSSVITTFGVFCMNMNMICKPEGQAKAQGQLGGNIYNRKMNSAAADGGSSCSYVCTLLFGSTCHP